MKSKELQDRITSKVQSAFATFPSLEDVPELSMRNEGATAVQYEQPGNEQQYIAALYELFFLAPDKDLAGRTGTRLEATE